MAKKPPPKKAQAANRAKAKKPSPGTESKGKVPARKKAAPKATMSPARQSGSPRARGDMNRPGPLGSRNGSGSGPLQGSAPQSMGGIGLGGYGM